jgi:hypothetical protein
MSTDDEQERLLRALRAPGSHAELSEEEEYRAMFRAARSPSAPVTTRHSRAPSRLLIGGAVAAVLAVGTGGVAAAYSGNLPSPIQNLAHHVIGAPEASPLAPSSESPVPSARTPSSPSGPTTGASRSPSGRATHQPSHQPRRPVPASGASGSATASKSATALRSPIPSSSPTSTGTPAPLLTGVMVVGAPRRADVGARVRFSGQLTYSETPTARQRVVLQEQVGSRWTSVSHGRTDADGSITLIAPSLQRTCRFRLLAGQGSGAVHSVPWRVTMHPLVTADVSASKSKATIDVTTFGAFGGDEITLATRRNGRLLIVSQARVDASGSASFVVTPDQRRTSYNLVLEPTKRHTSARVGVVVRLARETGGR